MDNNNYKRQYRQLNDTTKQKISQSLRGRTKSATHTQAISNGLKKYWAPMPLHASQKATAGDGSPLPPWHGECPKKIS